MRYLLCLVVLVSCVPQHTALVGTYAWKSGASADIHLGADSTFTYRYQVENMEPFHSGGRWRVSGRQLLLTSTLRSDNDLIQGVETHNASIPEHIRRINLYGDNGKPIEAFIVVDPPDEKHVHTGMSDISDGMEVQKPIHRVALLFLSWNRKYLWYTMRDTTANDLALHIHLSAADRYVYFNDQPWEIGRNQLTDTSLHKKEVFRRIP